MHDIPACRLPNSTIDWMIDRLSAKTMQHSLDHPSHDDVHFTAVMAKLFGDGEHTASDHDLTMTVALLEAEARAANMQLEEMRNLLAENPDNLDINPPWT